MLVIPKRRKPANFQHHEQSEAHRETVVVRLRKEVSRLREVRRTIRIETDEMTKIR